MLAKYLTSRLKTLTKMHVLCVFLSILGLFFQSRAYGLFYLDLIVDVAKITI